MWKVGKMRKLKKQVRRRGGEEWKTEPNAEGSGHFEGWGCQSRGRQKEASCCLRIPWALKLVLCEGICSKAESVISGLGCLCECWPSAYCLNSLRQAPFVSSDSFICKPVIDTTYFTGSLYSLCFVFVNPTSHRPRTLCLQSRWVEFVNVQRR